MLKKKATVETTATTTPATGSPSANGQPKTPCPITREQFRTAAKPVTVVIAGVTLAATPKEFSTGSLGFMAQGKVVIDVGGTPVTFQVGLNLTAVNSKELPK